MIPPGAEIWPYKVEVPVTPRVPPTFSFWVTVRLVKVPVGAVI